MHASSPLTSALRTGRVARRASAFGLILGLTLPLGAVVDGANAPAAQALSTAVGAAAQPLVGPSPEEAAQAAAAKAAAEAQAAAEAAALAAAEAARTWHIPVGVFYISSYYGEARYSGPHIGLDFAGNDGHAVLAARHGTVTQAGWEGGYGFAVSIDHGDGYVTKYAHLAAQPVVAVGQAVVGGQHIGNVGNTGDSTGPHLHFEMRNAGQLVDPGAVIAIPASQGIAVP